MFQTKVIEKIKTYFMLDTFFKIVPFGDMVEKYCRAGQTTDDNIAHAQYTLHT